MNYLNRKFWKNKKIFITGHTGFKGTWMVILLQILGSKIIGFSNKEKKNIFFKKMNFSKNIKNYFGDIRNYNNLKNALLLTEPDIIIHMAAKSIVKDGYNNPMSTFTTNINGTLNILEISKSLKKLKTILIVTSDKVYKNSESKKNFKEGDQLGGDDPYSSSKSGADMISNSYYESFFKMKKIGFGILRAGNVYGGGDFNEGRLFPDIMMSIFLKKKLEVRNPSHIRPWQHVFDCIYRYLVIAEKLFNSPEKYSGEWNIGPNKNTSTKVIDIIKTIRKKNVNLIYVKKNQSFNEKKIIRLNVNKFNKFFNINEINIEQGIKLTFEWYKNHYDKNGIEKISISHIKKLIQKYQNE